MNENLQEMREAQFQISFNNEIFQFQIECGIQFSTKTPQKVGAKLVSKNPVKITPLAFKSKESPIGLQLLARRGGGWWSAPIKSAQKPGCSQVKTIQIYPKKRPF